MRIQRLMQIQPNGQVVMEWRTHGGRRKGAGRKASPDREGFAPHARRPEHDFRNPVHVTMRGASDCPSLRTQRALGVIHRQLARLLKRDGTFRVNHFSVQQNHLHMIVESDDRRALWRGVQWLAARIARAVNRIFGRRGSLWRDRYHRHDLSTAREVRNCLVYVLFNIRKHDPLCPITKTPDGAALLDPCSSAAWFDGFEQRAGPLLALVRSMLARYALLTPPVSPPETWLATAGWRLLGAVRVTEGPRTPRRPSLRRAWLPDRRFSH
jgi:putative transposase